MLTPILKPALALLAFGAWCLPPGFRARRRVRWRRNLCYRPQSPSSAHLLDILTPQDGQGPWPLAIYIHGGGFGVGSKQTHALFAARLCEAGFVVANLNYRLAPEHRHPAALQDVAHAWAYLAQHAADFGARTDKVVVMGESAGANLALALSLGLCAASPPAWAEVAASCAMRPTHLELACGLFDVSRPERFASEARPPKAWIQKRIKVICQNVLPPHASGEEDALRYASPLKLMEGDFVFAKPLPSMALRWGDADPIRSDSERLAQALDERGTPAVVTTYSDAGHVFFAWPMHRHTETFWRDVTRGVAQA